MKAVLCRRYGSPDVLTLEDVPMPAPAKGEVLVKVFASSVNSRDWRLMRADPFLVRLSLGPLKLKQPILGADVAGRVEAIGAGVARFQPGDEVFGLVHEFDSGTFAEFVCIREDDLVRKSPDVPFEQAAAIPLAALTALQALNGHGKLQPGKKVLIHGASGGVGSFAVQLAKILGAEVTAVCSTKKTEMAHALGADRVIDYTRDDFAKSESRFDLILAINGNRSIFDYRRALAPRGVYIMVGGETRQLFQALILGPLLSLFGERMMRPLSQTNRRGDLEYLKTLLDEGKLTPVIDRSYTLAAVPDAMRYVEAGRATGKVVITVA